MSISKPSVNRLDWVPSADPTRIIEPTSGKKLIGWSPQEPYPAQNANWINYSNDQWNKYLERITDVLSNNFAAILGSSAQVTDGLATHDTPQAAYDAAHAAGGGIVKVLAGTHTGNLDMNEDSGVIFQGVGLQSIIDGNVLLSGDNNAFKAIDITGTISITGADNFVGAWVQGVKYLFPVGLNQGIQIEVLSNITLNESMNGATLLVDTSGGAIDIELPPARAEFKFTAKIKDATNLTTIVRNGSEEIEFQAQDFEISEAGSSLSFYCDGTDWFIVTGLGTGGGVGAKGTKDIDDDYTVLPEDNGKVLNVDTRTKAIEITLSDKDTYPENFLVTVKDYFGNADEYEIETVLAEPTDEMDGEPDGVDIIDEDYKAVTFVKNEDGFTRLTYLPSKPFGLPITSIANYLHNTTPTTEKFLFASETFTSVTNPGVPRNGFGAGSSETHGYMAGGFSHTSAERINFASETWANLAAGLGYAPYGAFGCHKVDSAMYFAGGDTSGGGNFSAPTTNFRKILFSTDAISSLSAIGTAVQIGNGLASDTKGYLIGGTVGGYTNDSTQNETVVFSTDTRSTTSAAPETMSRQNVAWHPDVEAGFLIGYARVLSVGTPTNQSTIRKLLMTTDTWSLSAEVTTPARSGGGGASNLAGFTLYDQITATPVNKFDFNSESISTISVNNGASYNVNSGGIIRS
jgi:hypothetical protein